MIHVRKRSGLFLCTGLKVFAPRTILKEHNLSSSVLLPTALWLPRSSPWETSWTFAPMEEGSTQRHHNIPWSNVHITNDWWRCSTTCCALDSKHGRHHRWILQKQTKNSCRCHRLWSFRWVEMKTTTHYRHWQNQSQIHRVRYIDRQPNTNTQKLTNIYTVTDTHWVTHSQKRFTSKRQHKTLVGSMRVVKSTLSLKK